MYSGVNMEKLVLLAIAICFFGFVSDVLPSGEVQFEFWCSIQVSKHISLQLNDYVAFTKTTETAEKKERSFWSANRL